MQERETIIRSTNLYTRALSNALRESTPLTYENDERFEKEYMLEIRDKKAKIIIWGILILMFYVHSTRLEPWNGVHWMFLAVNLITIAIGFWLISQQNLLIELRTNITRHWILAAATAGLPVVSKSLGKSGNDKQAYKHFQREYSHVIVTLKTKAEKISKEYPLSQFKEEMTHFINLDKELKHHVTECYKLAETLGVRGPVHA